MREIIGFIADLDRSIILFLNQFEGRSRIFDQAMKLLTGEPLIQGSFLFLFIWWLWFSNGETRSEDRIRAIRAAVGIVAALILARATQILLHGRPRPVNDPTLAFVAPSGLGYEKLEHWSSFPSDHAVIYGAIAMVIWMRDRRLGWLAFAWTLVVGSLPRLYLGLHYPTDVVGGLLLGTAIGYLTQRIGPPAAITDAVLFWERRHSQIFYPLAVLFTFELLSLFDDVRSVGRGIVQMLF
jgi:undecaprenyl-diphosphatase